MEKDTGGAEVGRYGVCNGVNPQFCNSGRRTEQMIKFSNKYTYVCCQTSAYGMLVIFVTVGKRDYYRIGNSLSS
jgi:hypothetical protein